MLRNKTGQGGDANPVSALRVVPFAPQANTGRNTKHLPKGNDLNPSRFRQNDSGSIKEARPEFAYNQAGEVTKVTFLPVQGLVRNQ